MSVDIVDFIWRIPSGVVIIIMLIYALRSPANALRSLQKDRKNQKTWREEV